jgi:hypothetical protein
MKHLVVLSALSFFLVGCGGTLDDLPVESEADYAARTVTKGPIFVFYGAHCKQGKEKPKFNSPGCGTPQRRPKCVFHNKAMKRLGSNKGEVVVVTEAVCRNGNFAPRGDFRAWRDRGSRRRLALKMPRWARSGGKLRDDSLAFLLKSWEPEPKHDDGAVNQALAYIDGMLGLDKFDYIALDEINWKYKKESGKGANAWRDGGHLARRLVQLLERMSASERTRRRMIVYFNSYNLNVKLNHPDPKVKDRLARYRSVIRAASKHGRIIASEIYNLNRSHLIDELAARFEQLAPGSNRRLITVIGVSPKYKIFSQTHAESVVSTARWIRKGACPLTRRQPGFGGYSLTHMGKLPAHMRVGQATALRGAMSDYPWPQAGMGEGPRDSTRGCAVRRRMDASPPPEEIELAVDDEVINEDEEDRSFWIKEQGSAYRGPGDPCPCPASLLCVLGKCREPCAHQACNGSGGCSPGQACVMTEKGVAVCMPGRGRGQTCDAGAPCSGGLLCLTSGDAASGKCYAACATVGAGCAAGGTCTGGISGSSCLYCY